MTEENQSDELKIDWEGQPPFIRDLWEGRMVPVDYEQNRTEKPHWFDENKFKCGQKFSMEHLLCINFAEIVSLYLSFAVENALDPLIFTGKSDTPFKAFKRYLSTYTRFLSWYQGNPWDEESESRKNIRVVRMMHKLVYKRLTSATNEELQKKTTVGEEDSENVYCPSREVLLQDFQASCPAPVPGAACPYARTGISLSQGEMAVAQFAFVGLVVTFPKDLGIHFASDEDLNGYLHVWRTIGYLLGIDDHYNFCNDELEVVRKRTLDLINFVIKPSLRSVSPDWEHMCRCLTAGTSFYVPIANFEAFLAYLCDILKIPMPGLQSSLTFWQSILYKIICFSFRHTFRLKCMVALHNSIFNMAVKRAKNAHKERLQKWEKKEFSFMKQSKVQKISHLDINCVSMPSQKEDGQKRVTVFLCFLLGALLLISLF